MITEIKNIARKMTPEKSYRWIFRRGSFFLIDDDDTLYVRADKRAEVDSYTAENRARGFAIDDQTMFLRGL